MGIQEISTNKSTINCVTQMLIINKWENFLKMRQMWNENPNVSRLLPLLQWQKRNRKKC